MKTLRDFYYIFQGKGTCDVLVTIFINPKNEDYEMYVTDTCIVTEDCWNFICYFGNVKTEKSFKFETGLSVIKADNDFDSGYLEFEHENNHYMLNFRNITPLKFVL